MMNIQHPAKSAPSRHAVLVRFGYLESTLPPRCRIPRLVERDDGEYIIRIPLLTGSDAPVALVASGVHLANDKKWRVEYRWWNRRLWTSVHIDGSSEPRGRTARADDWDWPQWADQVDLRASGANHSHEFGFDRSPFGSKADTVRSIRNWAKDHVIIDGIAHRSTRERGYRVTTFGLGDNHSGTALFVDAVSDTREAKRLGMFNLLDRENAIAYAAAVASKRGDTKSLPMSINGDIDWEILLPEVLRISRR